MGLFDLFKKKEVNTSPVRPNNVVAMVNGTVKELKELNDGMFSEKLLGDGLAISPVDGKIVAPIDGEVKVVFPTGHAYGFESESGVEILVHIGIDTVDMNGNGFKSLVKVGDKVRAGDPIAKIDLAAIKAAGHPDDVIVICTNGKKVSPLATAGASISVGADLYECSDAE